MRASLCYWLKLQLVFCTDYGVRWLFILWNMMDLNQAIKTQLHCPLPNL